VTRRSALAADADVDFSAPTIRNRPLLFMG
jgi:hypothetical protein